MILIVNGSPNKDGNCNYIKNKAAEILTQQKVDFSLLDIVDVLRDLEFPFCTACATPCPQVCENKSSKLKSALDLLRNCDGLILISPVYFGTCTAEIKAFWDLARHLRNENALYNKIGAAVTVGATKFGGQETALRTLQDMMFVQGMIVVGDGYGKNMGHQGTCFLRPSSDDIEGNSSLERIVMRVAETTALLHKLK